MVLTDPKLLPSWWEANTSSLQKKPHHISDIPLPWTQKVVNSKTFTSRLFYWWSYNWWLKVKCLQQLQQNAGLSGAPWYLASSKSEQVWPETPSLHFLEFLWCSSLWSFKNGQTLTSDVHYLQLTKAAYYPGSHYGRATKKVRAYALTWQSSTTHVHSTSPSVLHFDVLPHPPYNPDINSPIFHLFHSLQHFPADKAFSDVEEVKAGRLNFLPQKLWILFFYFAQFKQSWKKFWIQWFVHHLFKFFPYSKRLGFLLVFVVLSHTEWAILTCAELSPIELLIGFSCAFQAF